MNKIITLMIGFWLCVWAQSNAQNVAINTTGSAANSSAILDLSNTANLGFLPPQVALTATNAASPITSPATGLVVYNTATAGSYPNNVIPGYYYNSGTPASPVWVPLTPTIHYPFTIYTGTSTNTYYSQCNPIFGTFTTGEWSTTTPANLGASNYYRIAEWGFVAPANMTITSVAAWEMCLSVPSAPIITLYVYVYSPVSGTSYTSSLTGTLAGSQAITLSLTGGNNGVYECTFTPNYSITAGQVVMIYATTSSAVNNTITGTMQLQYAQ